LLAYELTRELVRRVAATPISEPRLREQARKSACSCALNTAEAAARWNRADKSRVFALARAERCESVAAVEIAEALGACQPEHLARVQQLGKRVSDMLSRLVR
jgi:four helix bundle protein